MLVFLFIIFKNIFINFIYMKKIFLFIILLFIIFVQTTSATFEQKIDWLYEKYILKSESKYDIVNIKVRLEKIKKIIQKIETTKKLSNKNISLIKRLDILNNQKLMNIHI